MEPNNSYFGMMTSIYDLSRYELKVDFNVILSSKHDYF